MLNAPLPRRASTIASVLDQAVSSGTNFVAVVLAAAALTPVEFGRYSIAYVLFTIVAGAFQSFVGQELVLIEGSPERRADASAVALRVTLLLSLLPVAGLLVAAALLPDLRAVLVVLAIALPLLVMQDEMRFAASLEGRMHVAVILDSIWAAILVVVVVGAMLIGSPLDDSAQFVAAWVGAGAVAGIAGLLFFWPFRRVADPELAGGRYRGRDFLGLRFLAEFAAIRGSSQALGVAVGAVASLAVAGAFRGVTTLFGPMNVLIGAIGGFGVSLLRPLDRRGRDRWIVGVAAILSACAAAVIVVLLLLPEEIGELLLGDTWTGAYPLILPIGCQVIALSVSTVIFIGLRVESPRSTLRIRLITAVPVLLFFFIGLWLGGIVGAAWGLFASAVFQAGIGAVTYLRHRGDAMPQEQVA